MTEYNQTLLEPDKGKFVNIIEPTNYANVRNTCNSDVHKQVVNCEK